MYFYLLLSCGRLLEERITSLRWISVCHTPLRDTGRLMRTWANSYGMKAGPHPLNCGTGCHRATCGGESVGLTWIRRLWPSLPARIVGFIGGEEHCRLSKGPRLRSPGGLNVEQLHIRELGQSPTIFNPKTVQLPPFRSFSYRSLREYSSYLRLLLLVVLGAYRPPFLIISSHDAL